MTDPRIFQAAQQLLAEIQAAAEIADLDEVYGYTVCCSDPATGAQSFHGLFADVVDAFIWADRFAAQLNTGYSPDDEPPWNQPWEVTVKPILRAHPFKEGP